MAEIHAARCDAPGCTNEAPLMMRSAVTAQTGSTIQGFQMAYAFSLPAGWRKLDGNILCSWACVAAYAEQRSKEGG